MDIELIYESLEELEKYLKELEALAYRTKETGFGELVQVASKQCNELQGALLVIESIKQDI